MTCRARTHRQTDRHTHTHTHWQNACKTTSLRLPYGDVEIIFQSLVKIWSFRSRLICICWKSLFTATKRQLLVPKMLSRCRLRILVVLHAFVQFYTYWKYCNFPPLNLPDSIFLFSLLEKQYWYKKSPGLWKVKQFWRQCLHDYGRMKDSGKVFTDMLKNHLKVEHNSVQT